MNHLYKVIFTAFSTLPYIVIGLRYLYTGGHFSSTSNLFIKLRINCINPASVSIKEGLFSSIQLTLRNNLAHPLHE